MSEALSPPPPRPPSMSPTYQHQPQPVGVMYQRLEHLEQKLTIVQGFIQKLFGNNFEEYCQSIRPQIQVPKNNRYHGWRNYVTPSSLDKHRVSQNDDRDKTTITHEEEQDDDVEILEHCNPDPNVPNPDVVQELQNGQESFKETETTVTPIASTSTIRHELFNHNQLVHHSSDPLVNPFLEETGEENDPIAINDGEGGDSPSGSGDGQVGKNQGFSGGGDETGSDPAGIVLGEPSNSGGRGTAESESAEPSFIGGGGGDPGSEQDPDRLFFFDDGVDQQQFSGYFEEEDAEPFDTVDEERDVKVLTILDMTDPNNDSTSTLAGGHQNNFSYSNTDMDNDNRPIRIKFEHGQRADSDDTNIIESQGASCSSISGDSRYKRRANSLPTATNYQRRRGPGRPPKSMYGEGQSTRKKIKTEGASNSDQDSDFQLESGEENAAEFSSSSSSSDNDPDWKARPQSQTQPHRPYIKVEPARRPRGVFSPFRGTGRLGRRPNYSKITQRIPPNLVPLLPKTSASQSFDLAGPNGTIVLNMTSSPTSTTPTMIPIPANSGMVSKVSTPKRGRPPASVPKVARNIHNPITQLPKVINGVYFRLISLSADKRNHNVMVVKAKCALCDAAGYKPVIVQGFGKSETSFYEHFKRVHPAEYIHYRANAQKIDAATMKLRQVISQHPNNSGPNNEAIFISQYLRKITSLTPFVS